MSIYPANTTNPKKGSDKYLWNWLSSSLKKFAQAICPYLQDIGCAGGGGGFVEVTYTELLSLISSAGLTPGATYKITGFNKNGSYSGDLPDVLYDDGTDSGITIYMKAVSADLMESTGYGEFYNPKYTGQAEYANTDGTGLHQIWDGNNPDPLQVPAYGIGDVVYWGGYAWVNDTGNVGNAVNDTELSSDWDKLPYTATNYYELVTDEISVDWNIGMVVGRRNAANKVSVQWTAEHWSYEGYYNWPPTNPVALVPWGLYSDVPNSDNQGIADLTVIDTTCDLINFKGNYAIANYFGAATYFYGNYFGKYTQLYQNSFDLYSQFLNNTFFYGSINYNEVTNSSINANTVLPGATVNIQYNVLKSFSYINGNTFAETGTGLYSNFLLDGSNINDNNLGLNSTIAHNHLENSSRIYDNSLDNGSRIEYNHLENNCEIYDNYDMDNGSQIGFNIMTNQSTIYYNEMDASNIVNNTLSNSSYITELTIASNSAITYNTMDNSSYMSSFTIENNSNITRNSMTNSSYIENTSLDSGQINSNTFDNSNMSDYNTLNSSSISNNTFYSSIYNGNSMTTSIVEFNSLFKSEMNNNTIEGSNISYNTFGNANINNNNLSSSSSISYNEVGNSTISGNTISSSNIDSNSLIAISGITNTSLGSGAMIVSNSLVSSTFGFGSSGTLSGVTISNNHAKGAQVTVDISLATYIYGTYTKEIFHRQDGQLRLSYYNNSNVLTVVNVTD